MYESTYMQVEVSRFGQIHSWIFVSRCFEAQFDSGDGKPREAVRVLFSGPLNRDGSKSMAYDSDEMSTDDESLPDTA